ncbi:hypothetical protein [Prochlorococcus sp. MIT 1341]|uniref:hypothetical protein n=1 Tax=Prochlorococcus sp. MIT 1341 TaxID=3096221 RepID=UPI002A761ECE|nr:hypothetical protein [Prochlorococcus sp. MIT 1341]
MSKKDWFGIFYVSIWIVIWGSVGSVIDLPLLNADLYLPGSLGQIITFTLTALASTAIGILLFPKARRLVIKD